MSETIIAWLFSKHWMVSLPAFTLLGLALSPYGRIWKNEHDRKRWVGYLCQGGFQRTYRRTMTAVLDRIDLRLSRDEMARDLPPHRIAWSISLLNLVMMLAVAYPILSATLQWLSGSEIGFGQQRIVAAGQIQERLFLVVWLASSLAFFFLAFRLKLKLRTLSLVVAALLLLVGSSLAVTVQVPNPIAIASVGIIAVVGANFFPLPMRGSISISITIAGGLAAAMRFYFDHALFGTTAFAAICLFLIGLTGRSANQRLSRTLLLIMLFGITLSCTVFLGGLVSAQGNEGRIYIILILGLLPLMNSLADFASVGLTRFLMRRGLDGVPWWHSFLDIAGGIAIFFTLGFAIMTWLHFVRLPDGSALVDLRGLFEGLRTHPWDYGWLAFMLFTTLIPTVLHLMIGVMTCLIVYPEPVRAWIVNMLSNGHQSDVDGWIGSLSICAIITLSFWSPIILGAVLLGLDHGGLLQDVITVFVSYGLMIGAF